MKILDKDGLSYFWAKLKTLLNGKLDADAVSSTGTASTGWNNCRLSGGKIQYYNTNTTYSAATTSSAGLMSASDKTKLNGIDTGATKTTVDTVLSITSTNPVQNKTVQAAILPLQDFIFGVGTTLAKNDDLNNYNQAGKFNVTTGAIAQTIANTPWTASGFTVIVMAFITTTTFMQFLIPSTVTGKWYRRRYTQGTWSKWIEYDGTEVT